MKSAWIRKAMTVVLAAACVMTALPAAAAEMSEGETELISTEESGALLQENTEVSETAGDAEEQEPAVVSAAEEQVEQVPVFMSAAEELTGQETAAVPAVTDQQEKEEAETAADRQETDVMTDDGENSGETDAEEAESVEPEEDLEQEPDELEIPVVSYCTHVQTFGWQDYVKDGEMSGTSGQSKRLEGIRIKVSGVEDLGVEYCTHVQGIGWQNYVADGAMSGTEGQSRRLEAIRIRLTGKAASKYDIYYCVHVQNYGWLNWARNDQNSGTAGYSKRLEGIRIMILPKGSQAPVSIAGAVSSFINNEGGSDVGFNEHKVIYNTHVQTYGWQDWVGDGELGGTSGESKRLEGLHIMLQNQDVGGSIEYRTHVQGIGWQDWVRDGEMAGTSGQSRRLEALQIRLTGEMVFKYDIWYRTHVQNFGWRGWTKNGAEAGSEGYSYRMEAIEIKLLPKGSEAPGSTEDPFSVSTIRDQYPLACQRLDQIGWDLRQAFIWSASMPYYRLPQDISYGARFFATYGFEHGNGDCYVMAACFYEMAKALGYDAHWMFGYVPMAAGGMGVHSWVEIDMNGTTYVCDPDYTHETGANGYMNAYWWSGWGYYNSQRMN